MANVRFERIQVAIQSRSSLMAFELKGFADDSHAVDVHANHGAAVSLGWTQRQDGMIEMHGDIQRISHQSGIEQLLQRVNRRYALLYAIDQVSLGAMGSADLILQPH